MRSIRIVADAEAVAQEAADLFARVTTEAVAARGRARVALSGGSTPRRMGELLAEPSYRGRVPWDRLVVFWGDERWVPESSPESNAGVAKRTFLDRVPVPPSQIHAWPTDAADPTAAATAYEATIRQEFGLPAALPRFDLVLLGMGDDGHTASLFPQTAALDVRDALAVANHVPKHDAFRLTLTIPVLRAGREIVCLVTGAGKADRLAEVLHGPDQPDALPVQSIRPTAGRFTWLIDAAAAARLDPGLARDG